MRRTNEKVDGTNASKYKVVPALYSNRSKAKHVKKKITIRVTSQGSRLYD